MVVETLKNGDTSPAITVWLTGIPRSGKTTLAYALRERFWEIGQRSAVLDGDEIRERLSPDLGFSERDRELNVRRIGYVASLLTRNGVISIVAAVSPYRSGRDQNRELLEKFVEIYCHCPVDVAARRDFKGIYERAQRGEIRGVTGLDAPYEVPISPEATVNTGTESVAESLEKIWRVLREYVEARPLDSSPRERVSGFGSSRTS